MPDISMCNNGACPSRYDCFRYMAKPDPYWQAYATFEYDRTGKCESFDAVWRTVYVRPVREVIEQEMQDAKDQPGLADS